MPDLTAADWLAATPGLIACAGGAWLWLTKFSDAKQLEEMSAGIRRDVEQSLKTHESRLRVATELQLRLHERSWLLMREFMAAALAAHESVMGYAMNLGFKAMENRTYETLMAERSKAAEAVIRLQAIAIACPPELDAITLTAPFKEASRMAIDIMGNDDSEVRSALMKKVRAELDRGLGAVAGASKRWNESLWLASSEVPLLAKEPSTTIEKT